MNEENGELRVREPKGGEYVIESVVQGCGIICCRPGVKLIDFYRTPTQLAKDVPVKESGEDL